MAAFLISARPMAAGSSALAIVLWCGEGRAYCPEVTQAAPANYDPATKGCFQTDADSGAPLPTLFWRSKCVGYSIQQDASSQVSLADATRIAKQAFGAWAAAACAGGSPSISATALDPVQCGEVPPKGHNNAIIFRDNGWPYPGDRVNSLGYTTLTVDKKTGEIYGADIEINTSDYMLGTAGASDGGSYDLASVLTHEAGHFLGLAHSTDSKAVMYAFYHPGSTALSLDDVAGICSTYAPDGTRTTLAGALQSNCCDTTPPAGFSTQCGAAFTGHPTAGCGADASAASGDDGGVAQNDEAGADAGDPCPTSTLACTMRPYHRAGCEGMLAFAFVGLGALGRRLGVSARPARGSGALAALSLTVGALIATSSGDAKASVSIMASFDALVQRASAAAVVTAAERQSLWEDGRIVTYTHAHVDRLVAGRLPAEIWLRTLGGDVGDVEQIVEGEASFELGGTSLVFVHENLDADTRAPTGAFGVIERGQGQFPVMMGDDGRRRLVSRRDVGVLLAGPAPARATGAEPASTAVSRPARDVLDGRLLDEAAHTIAAAWLRTRPFKQTAHSRVP